MPRPCYYSLYTFDAAAICEAYGQQNFVNFPTRSTNRKTENKTNLTFTRKEKEKIVGYCADADDIKSLLLQHTKTIFFRRFKHCALKRINNGHIVKVHFCVPHDRWMK